MSERKYINIEIFNEGKEMEVKVPKEGSAFLTKTITEKMYPFKAKDMDGNTFYGYITMRKGDYSL